jgi:hypothetical protein
MPLTAPRAPTESSASDRFVVDNRSSRLRYSVSKVLRSIVLASSVVWPLADSLHDNPAQQKLPLGQQQLLRDGR